MGKITREGGYIFICDSLEDRNALMFARNLLEEDGFSVVCPNAKSPDESYSLFVDSQEKQIQNRVYLGNKKEALNDGLCIKIGLPVKSRLAVKRKLINFTDSLKIYIPYAFGDGLIADRLSETLASKDLMVISEEIEEGLNPSFIRENHAGTIVVPVTQSSFESKFLSKILTRDDPSSLYLVFFGDTWFSSGFGKTREYGEFYLENIPSEDSLCNLSRAIQDSIKSRLENI